MSFVNVAGPCDPESDKKARIIMRKSSDKIDFYNKDMRVIIKSLGKVLYRSVGINRIPKVGWYTVRPSLSFLIDVLIQLA